MQSPALALNLSLEEVASPNVATLRFELWAMGWLGYGNAMRKLSMLTSELGEPAVLAAMKVGRPPLPILQLCTGAQRSSILPVSPLFGDMSECVFGGGRHACRGLLVEQADMAD
jgi:hypothetical protein